MFVGCQAARGTLAALQVAFLRLWWNLGKDKTLGRCDGAAKWRIRMGASAVVACTARRRSYKLGKVD